jgi:hypothetical protein
MTRGIKPPQKNFILRIFSVVILLYKHCLTGIGKSTLPVAGFALLVPFKEKGTPEFFEIDSKGSIMTPQCQCHLRIYDFTLVGKLSLIAKLILVRYQRLGIS